MKFKVGDMVIDNHPTRYEFTNKGWIGKVTKINETNGFMTVLGVGNALFNDEFNCLDPKYFDPYVKEKIVITHDGKTTTATMYRGDGSKEQATARCCPEDTFDFNVGAKLAMERLMEKVSPVTPVTMDGFKIGDRVNRNGVNGTVICFAETGTPKIGVEFDDKVGFGHNCGGVPLKAGAYGTKDASWWCYAYELSHGEVVKPEPPKYYNGKVVCTANKYGCSIPVPGFTVGKIYEVVDGRITNDDGWTSHGNDTNLRDLCVDMGNTFIPLVEDVEDKNEPLTTEELMTMDGQKVWLSSIDDDVENFTDGYCGWYTVNVANVKLYRNESFGGWYEIKDNCGEYGFKAYRTPPKEVKEVKEDKE